jgi:hypothetical protein
VRAALLSLVSALVGDKISRRIPYYDLRRHEAQRGHRDSRFLKFASAPKIRPEARLAYRRAADIFRRRHPRSALVLSLAITSGFFRRWYSGLADDDAWKTLAKALRSSKSRARRAFAGALRELLTYAPPKTTQLDHVRAGANLLAAIAASDRQHGEAPFVAREPTRVSAFELTREDADDVLEFLNTLQ